MMPVTNICQSWHPIVIKLVLEPVQGSIILIITSDKPLIGKVPIMNISHLSTNILTHTAIAALKSAYEQCSDKAAKESIISAFKAVIQLHHDLGRLTGPDRSSEIDSDFDPSEYCAAV